jgi:hypothetical protein
MKKNYNAALQCRKGFFANSFIYLAVITTGLFFTACQKDNLKKPAEVPNALENNKTNTDAAFINNYARLPFKTAWELLQARIATAKYQNVKNAIADGYEDIGIDVEHMGHHYMKKNLVDANFDIRHPEILVYNKDHSGKLQLVAVEYAVPKIYPKPEGFTGSLDVWDGDNDFDLWLLHAWVWYKNPEGVFKPFNPQVHLH